MEMILLYLGMDLLLYLLPDENFPKLFSDFLLCRKMNEIHLKSGVLFWRCNTEEEPTGDGAKVVFLKERYPIVALECFLNLSCGY